MLIKSGKTVAGGCAAAGRTEGQGANQRTSAAFAMIQLRLSTISR